MVPFETADPDIDESPIEGETPEELVKRLSVAKAKVVASVYTTALVIGSDQVAVHDGKIVGKPHTHENAVEQLREASGKTITLYTGLALINTQTKMVQSEVIPFKVHFRRLNDDIIEAYLRKEKPYDCAGSVRSESLGIVLLKKFEGDDPNALIGLPLIELVTMLQREKYSLFR